jgi:hypothetical protein
MNKTEMLPVVMRVWDTVTFTVILGRNKCYGENTEHMIKNT